MGRPKKESLADRMLEMLENAYPEGVLTTEIAQEIYGSPSLENRVRVARLARSLRRLGYRAYGIGGVYHLGTENVLEIVTRRYEKMACGFLLGGAEAARGMEELGDPARAKTLRQGLRKAVAETLKAV
ncbi:MAG: hypothetical protein C4575_09835 [Desulforudis sp.]|nr:MAG: hypothetical protein C4575_09835 [Desulforudis sp.]